MTHNNVLGLLGNAKQPKRRRILKAQLSAKFPGINEFKTREKYNNSVAAYRAKVMGALPNAKANTRSNAQRPVIGKEELAQGVNSSKRKNTFGAIVETVNDINLEMNETIPRTVTLEYNPDTKDYVWKTVALNKYSRRSRAMRAGAALAQRAAIWASDRFATWGFAFEPLRPEMIVRAYIKHLRRFYYEYAEWSKKQNVEQVKMAKRVVSIMPAVMSAQVKTDYDDLEEYSNKMNMVMPDPAAAERDALEKIKTLMAEEIRFDDPVDLATLDPIRAAVNGFL